MDFGRYRILLTMIAVAIALVSARELKAGNRHAGFFGFLSVAVLAAWLLWSLLSP